MRTSKPWSPGRRDRGEITGLEVLIVTSRHAAEHLAHAELTRDWLRSRSR